MKSLYNFNIHLEEMLEFLELEKSYSNDFIPRVYEAQLNSLLNWKSNKPRLSKYLRDLNLIKPDKYKVKNTYNHRILANPAQLESVKMALNLPISCIQGPPGTGKTSVIVEVIQQELKRNPKKIILVTSQSNLAVDNVLERLINVKNIKFLRIGSDQKISENIKPYLLENIKSKLIFKSKLKSIFYNIFKFILLSPFLLLSKNPKFYSRKKNINLYEVISNQINVIGATCVGSSDNLIEYLGNKIGLVIVDEAGRSTGMETLIPLQYAERALMVGDHKQLPPVLKTEIRDVWSKKYGELKNCPGYYSFFEYISELISRQAFSILNVQFRMHPEIGDFIGEVFYNEEGLKSGSSNESFKLEGFPTAISYHSTQTYEDEKFEKFHDDLESYYNTAEAKIIVKLLELIKSQNLEIGVSVISFYSAQVELLKQLLNKKGIKKVEVATLDSYQGREQDIIILSLVRCNKVIKNFDAMWYRFFLDIKRLNVALSRAKKRLMIVGNLEQLLEIKRNRNDVVGFEVAEKLYNYIKDKNLEVKI